MNKNKTARDKLFGKEQELMPNIAFRMMTFAMSLIDLIKNYSGKNFDKLGLRTGQIVIDYGCGPARYILNASKTVGEKGKVYAIDIHPLAIKNVKEKIGKYQLNNVEAVLANGYSAPLNEKIADIVYALDMFHMIEQPTELLKELCRLLKDDGIIILEDGHQSRNETKQKIIVADILTIIEESKSHVKCKKIK